MHMGVDQSGNVSSCVSVALHVQAVELLRKRQMNNLVVEAGTVEIAS